MMENVYEELEALLERIDQRADMETVRRDVALLLSGCIARRREDLDSWEKMHYEMAIALLPTVWLRLAVTHIKAALETPEDRPEMDPDRAAALDGLTYDVLLARLAIGMV